MIEFFLYPIRDMKLRNILYSIILMVFAQSALATPHGAHPHNVAQLGPRPYYLVDDMSSSPLKSQLTSCAKSKRRFKKTKFSIGHRGAPMQFPEHTKESYVAGAKMGAGILECDVTFTKDKELVCRHAQCDLHATTNILATPLAAQCSSPFTPAQYDALGQFITPASAKCCTSDITLAEFKTLKGKMDAADVSATTVEQYMKGTADWRTDLYTGNGTLLSHKESIELFKSLKVGMTPELKSPEVPMPFNGFSQEDYAQKMIDEYIDADVKPKNVWPQSFNYSDVLYWLEAEPRFGKQAVYLDGRYADPTFDHTNPTSWSPSMAEIKNDGVNVLAPPMWMLVQNDNGQIVPSTYAIAAKAAGLDLITWTLERSGLLQNGGGWYYQTIKDLIDDDGDTYEMLDVLAQDVGILGIFTDWPSTVTFYANCMGLK